MGSSEPASTKAPDEV